MLKPKFIQGLRMYFEQALLPSFNTLPFPHRWPLVFEESITLPLLSLPFGFRLGSSGREVQSCIRNAAWGRATNEGYSYSAKLSLHELPRLELFGCHSMA